MDPRKYNIYFHTHTISGIIIAAVLYVIFFAGSFSFFKDDIAAWQKGRSEVGHRFDPPYNHLLDSLSRHYNLRGRNFNFYLLRRGQGAFVDMTASQDTTVSKPKPKPAREEGQRRKRRGDGDTAYFRYHFVDKKAGDYSNSYDMAEFLYRLHFLAQLNQVGIDIGTPFGYLIAGVVAFLFLFALITGLLLHWDKIKSNFFPFRPRSKWKTVWTDMHTALGVIGFPFQFVFAVTGVVLIVNYVLLTPFANLLYNGDTDKLYESLQFNRAVNVEYTYKPMNGSFDMDAFVGKWQNEWKGSQISRIYIRNYLDESMQVSLEAQPDPGAHFAGSGFATVNIGSGKVLEHKSPNTGGNYIDKVKSLIYHLHFGDFGGRPLRIAFFVLGLMGCAVILSGIMIWLVARDKVATELHKRRFNFWASNFFLAACLSMLPVTAFTFMMVKMLAHVDQAVIYKTYFYSWLALGSYLMALRNLSRMNRHTLVLSAVLCLGVPVANGISTGLWMWNTWRTGALDILFIDALFLVLAGSCAYACTRVDADAKPFRVLSLRKGPAGVLKTSVAGE